MAATIQVVLQQDVPNVGGSGELVKVRPGYARNFLVPRKLAVPATEAAVNRIAHEKAVAVAKNEKLRKEAHGLREKLEALEIKLFHKVGEEGRLFGSVTSKDIAAAIKAKGLEVEKKMIHLADDIKATGTYEALVKVFHDIQAKVKVEVHPKDK